ncbi:MAG: hypothetical protein HY275_19190 [Gemmatimonadetes bacterium]|nr:hypothetical protein [Gemmatimonadota bacterium]
MPAAPLLAGLVDYAGLFPPAGLSMRDAVAAYARESVGRDAWMLGRFVCPAARLAEFAEVAAASWPDDGAPWRVSALVPDPAADLARVHAFNAAHGAHAVVDTVEGRASTVAEVDTLAAAMGALDGYAELPLDPDPAALIGDCARLGLKAKARLGGVVADAIPRPELVARFLVRCRDGGIAFKATAGLHHAVRGAYPLTYEPNAPRATMHGFLNLLFATYVVLRGGDEAEACAALEERDGSAFAVEPDGLRWRSHVIPAPQGRRVREQFIAIGSCSFREPVADLAALGLP